MSRDIETERRNISHKKRQASKKHCHHGFNYKCHRGDTYFEIVRYYQDCEPVPITKIHLNGTINMMNCQWGEKEEDT